MADQPPCPDRLSPARLYTVTQLAEEMGVTARTVRFYEDKGLLAPRRAGATRIYSHRDRARLTLILRGKRLGFSLREIGEFLKLYVPGGTQQVQLRTLLDAVRARLDTLAQQRAALEQTLDELREIEQQALAALAGSPRRTSRSAAIRLAPMPRPEKAARLETPLLEKVP